MTADLRDLLFVIVAMLALVFLIRAANQPRPHRRRRWRFSMQSLLIALTMTAILLGLIAAVNQQPPWH